jgi:hypothetical protein
MSKGIFFSHDPGGTNALIPVVKYLQVCDIECLNYAASYAVPLWRKSGLPFLELPLQTQQEADEFISDARPDFVFTGTSEDTTHEGRLWAAARAQKVRTFSVIDHWTRYRERYLVNGKFSPTDVIFTIDEAAKKEMISLGFLPESILACGQPHFEKYQHYYSGISAEEFKKSLQLSRSKKILFVSDIVSISFPPVSGTPALGFDEHTTLDALLDAIERLPIIKNEVEMIIKLHPKEPLDNFSKLLASKKPTIPCHIISEADNLDLIYHSDFVIGMFSMMLFEAYLMKKPVLSLQLNSIQLTTFGQHKIPIVTAQTELISRLTDFIQNKLEVPVPPFTDSTRCIAQTIKHHLANSTGSANATV